MANGYSFDPRPSFPSPYRQEVPGRYTGYDYWSNPGVYPSPYPYDPFAGGFPSSQGGNGTTDGGDGGGFDWQKIMPWITGGIPAIGDILEARRSREQARKTQKGVEKQRAESLGFVAPEYLLQLLNLYRGAYREGYMPALRTVGESLALGEQSAMQGLESDVARRGLSGSGVHLAARQGLRSGRQASYGQAVRDYYMDVERAAREAAGQTSSRQLSASLGAPFYHIPQPAGTLETLFQNTPDYLRTAAEYKNVTSPRYNENAMRDGRYRYPY